MDARKFCQRFSGTLVEDDWGQIDPDLFHEIATADDEDSMSDEASALLDVLECALL